MKKNWSVVSKMTGIWWSLTWVLKVSKICTFIGSYCAKYLMFDLKKYRGVIFHDTEEWCKIWRKTDLWFGKWHEEYGKFSPEHLKVSKLGLWWDLLIQSSLKSMGLKFTEELCIMTMKNDAKFEEELTCCFKIDMGSLMNFDLSTWRHKKFSLECARLSKVYMVWAKKVKRSYLSWHSRVMQNLKKNWLVVWKMKWGILQIFTRALESVKIRSLMGYFCPE